MSFSPRAIKSLHNLIIVVFNEEKSNRNSFLRRWSRKNIILLDCPAGVSNCVICLETGAGLGGKARWTRGCGRGGTRRRGARVQSGCGLFFPPLLRSAGERSRAPSAPGHRRLLLSHLDAAPPCLTPGAKPHKVILPAPPATARACWWKYHDITATETG